MTEPHPRPDDVISGRDNVVSPRDEDTIVRRRLDAQSDGIDVEQEAALLEIVARVSPLPVPRVVSVSADRSAMVMERLPGEPLLHSLADVRAPTAARLGGQLGDLLAALRTIPIEDVRPLVPVESSLVGEYHADALRILDEVRPHLPGHVVGQLLEFLADPPPEEAPQLWLCHNDLGAEHVFVDGPGPEITGVIDWSDASITDPCLDLGLIWRDLGEAGFSAAMTRSRIDLDEREELVERARFYARVKALEDFEFGLQAGRDAYLRHASRALTRLF